MNKKLLVAVLMAMGTMKAFAADELPKPGAFDTAAGTLKATVQDIDYKTRDITLKGEEGNVVTMTAGPEITRFEQIKKGDIVQVDYLLSVAMMVQAPDKNIASAVGSQTAIVRNQGKKPSGTLVQTDVITATVEKIDAKARTATLKGPRGNLIETDVAPDVQNLENVKKGDQVLVKITRTVALDIRKPTKEDKKK